MNEVISLRRHLRKSIFKQSVFGMAAMVFVLAATAYFLGRYKAASDLEETAHASAKSFRSRILEGDIKSVELQMREALKLQASEDVQILNPQKQKIY
ncbi:MAG: hypothetical protein K2X47_10560, partial [Bdellovibrionales bacterium]|nr:hypothetical protein [Bdellovibrionales bacterium]